MTILQHAGVAAIKFYQKYLSKKACPFNPSCSQYMLEAIVKRGFFTGVFLGILRICRCNPFTKGGYDPVPDKKNIVKWLV